MAIPSEALDESGVEHRVHYTAVGLHLLEDLRRPGDLVLVDAAVKEDAVRDLRWLHPARPHQLEELEDLRDASRLRVPLRERVVGDRVGDAAGLRHLVQQRAGLVHAVSGHTSSQASVVRHAVDIGTAPAHLLHEGQRQLPQAVGGGVPDHVAVVLARGSPARLEAAPEQLAALELLCLYSAEKEAAPDAPVGDLQLLVLRGEVEDGQALGVELLGGAQLGGGAEERGGDAWAVAA
mmetsp:Transcript_86518/g.232115  ORF Transcript_86518/g.232115 Transcript_86518/m.232115 type:complete len:236 (-) Transcript_86518:630-1337(-)